MEIEYVKNEELSYSDDDLYNINSWGADLSFREIINMYKEDELLKPELQRKYVWTKDEASRFIDSILLGLPVPSIFFAKEPNETMLIIDGYQRIMTVYDYVNGIFTGDGKIFKLSNTELINKKWRGKSFADLDIEEKRRIKNTTIHAIIFEQKYPQNDTGMYQVFERINTGGKTLRPQEIRNCVYQGSFNSLLFRLNDDYNWRYILGNKDVDTRMMDMELILRFFAMSDLVNREEAHNSQINLCKYLNRYMGDNKNINNEEVAHMEDMFINTMACARNKIGNDVFKNLRKDGNGVTNKVNPAIFDAVSVAFSYAISKEAVEEKRDYKKLYYELLKDDEFKNLTTKRTTNTENIFRRINMVCERIFGIKYDRGTL